MMILTNVSKWITLLLLSFSMVAFIACDQQSPISSDTLEQQSTSKSLTFLKFGNSDKSLNKIITVTEWVTYDEGGELELEHKVQNPSNGQGSYCDIDLEIEEETISQDAEVSISLDDSDFFIGSFDMVFSPHGIVFSEPAILNIEIINADLSGINPKYLDIYYDNTDTGEWELMPRESIHINEQTGYVRIINAEIPHFSRYAIGTEN